MLAKYVHVSEASVLRPGQYLPGKGLLSVGIVMSCRVSGVAAWLASLSACSLPVTPICAGTFPRCVCAPAAALLIVFVRPLPAGKTVYPCPVLPT